MFYDRTKYLDFKVNFTRNYVEEKQVEFVKISTHNNPADMLTKALPSTKFKFCLNLVRLYDTTQLKRRLENERKIIGQSIEKRVSVLNLILCAEC